MHAKPHVFSDTVCWAWKYQVNAQRHSVLRNSSVRLSDSINVLLQGGRSPKVSLGVGLFRVGVDFLWDLFRLKLFWCSCKVLRFVEVSVNGSKHCKLRRISSRYPAKCDFGTFLAKCENAMKRMHAPSVQKTRAETTHQIAVLHGTLWISSKR